MVDVTTKVLEVPDHHTWRPVRIFGELTATQSPAGVQFVFVDADSGAQSFATPRSLVVPSQRTRIDFRIGNVGQRAWNVSRDAVILKMTAQCLGPEAGTGRIVGPMTLQCVLQPEVTGGGCPPKLLTSADDGEGDGAPKDPTPGTPDWVIPDLGEGSVGS